MHASFTKLPALSQAVHFHLLCPVQWVDPTAALVLLLYSQCVYICTGYMGFKALKEVVVSNLWVSGAG